MWSAGGAGRSRAALNCASLRGKNASGPPPGPPPTKTIRRAIVSASSYLWVLGRGSFETCLSAAADHKGMIEQHQTLADGLYLGRALSTF
jgi:hypothetical protein